MKREALLIFALVVATSLHAQDLSVVYLEGVVQVRSGASWTELQIGDAVPRESAIRLQNGGSLQLKGTGADFYLNRPGTYAIRDLVAARQKLSSKGVAGALINSLRSLAFGRGTNQNAAGGARAADKGKSEDDSWVESSAEVFLAAGREYIKGGKFDQAIAQLNEALDSATGEEIPEIQYYLAEASSLNGDVRGAWKQIADLRPGASDTWAGDFVLLKAKLLEDTSAYTEAVDWLKANDLSQDAQRGQLYLFLLGLGYRGANQEVGATAALGKVVAISAESDLGKAAGELLQ